MGDQTTPIGTAVGARALVARAFASLDEAWTAALAHEPDAEVRVAFDRALESVQAFLRGDLSDAEAPALEDLTALALEKLETDARAFMTQSDLEAAETARLGALLSARALALRRIVRRCAGLAQRDEVPYLLGEIQDIERDLVGPSRRTTATGKGGGTKDPEARRAFAEIVMARANATLAAARAHRPAADNLVETFRAYRSVEAAHTLLLHIEGDGDPALFETVDAVRGASAGLEDAVADGVVESAGREPAAALAIVDRWIEEIDDTRLAMTAAVAPPDASVQRLFRQSRQFFRKTRAALAGAVLAAPEEVAKTLKKRLRRVQSGLGRLADDRADRILRERTRSVFGRALSELWERLVFWLIVAALILLVVNHYAFKRAEHTPVFLIWADTAICAVLLVDFAVRFILTPRRGAFFVRNALTGLVAALPFSLVAYYRKSGWVEIDRILEVALSLKALPLLLRLFGLFRLVLFVTRAGDRVVDALAWLLNKDIVFFSEAAKQEGVPTLLKRVRDLEGWIRRSTHRLWAEMDRTERRTAAAWRLAFLRSGLRYGIAEDGGPKTLPADDLGPAELDAADVVRTLRELDESQVEEIMSTELAARLVGSLRVLRLPYVRNLPFCRYVFGTRGDHDTAGIVARLAHVAGDTVDLMQRFFQWFADLYGTITGAQFLDRLGLQIVRATGRPARRLILFGAIVGLGLAFIKILDIEKLDEWADRLSGILSKPVLVLGFLCLLPLGLGLWLRRIAGQAAEFYDRVAEAQFLSLTEITKEEQGDEHLRILAERVVLPEARLGGDVSAETRDVVLEAVRNEGLRRPFMTGLQEAPCGPAGVPWLRIDFILLYYRDFVDGAFFHRQDTKVANMLLGNLTLEIVRRDRLGYTKKDLRRLERLDIAHGKGGFAGPYVWFNFITQTTAQQTARLVLEYNTFCIPEHELAVADPADRERFETWIEKRTAQAALRKTRGRTTHVRFDVGDDESTRLTYTSTEFNALHFLTAARRRDEAVARRFGTRVLALLRLDRENLIRNIFGTYPMHELPVDQRTFNPYVFYQRFFAHGRVFLLPFVILWWFAKGLRFGARRTRRMVREVMNPDARADVRVSGRSGFEVARRKIHRMKRPVALEAMRLRAAFDVEYLGLALPGRQPTVQAAEQAAADLRRLDASEREWEEFRTLKSRREHQLRMLAGLLRQGRERSPESSLNALVLCDQGADAGEVRRRAEALRAVVAAFLTDHADCCSRLEAHRELVDLRNRLATHNGSGRRTLAGRFRRTAVREVVDRIWHLVGGDRRGDVELRARFTEAIVEGDAARRAHAELLSRMPAECEDVAATSLRTLEAVGERTSPWSEELVAVRTVQALALIDVDAYESVVRTLGNYGDPSDRGAAVADPTL